MDENNSGTKKLKKKKKSSAKKVVLIVLLTVISVILIITAAGVLLIHHYIGSINYVDPNNTEHNVLPGEDVYLTDDEANNIEELFPGGYPDDTGVGDVTEPPMTNGEIIWPDTDDITSFEDDKLINILIVGQDRRDGQSARQRTDSMILVSVNPETYQVSIISFLRDLWVQIPGGYKDNRLNVPYIYGGFKLLKDTLKTNFGITVDGCFECDFNDFKQIIDILGGVEIDVTEKESNYMKNSLGVNIPAGRSNLNGEQALTYARIRKLDSDFKRTKRQRTIMLAIFNKFKNASLIDLNNLANEILPKLSTDMTIGERWALLMEFLPVVSKMEVSSYSIPFSGSYTPTKIGKKAVLVPNLDKIRKKLAEEYLPF